MSTGNERETLEVFIRKSEKGKSELGSKAGTSTYFAKKNTENLKTVIFTSVILSYVLKPINISLDIMIFIF